MRLNGYKYLFLLLVLIMSTASLGIYAQAVANKTTDVVRIDLNPDKSFQVIDNFGASDAWAGQYVGLWDKQVKEKIADLLFSTRTDKKGNPQGIGLSAWRFNIGAGSKDQGDSSDIKGPWRRAEGFLKADGTYDFSSKVARGQRWWFSAAKKRGVKDFIAFSNSAPYQLTKNGKTYATNGLTNLAEDNYGAFADYLVEVIKGIKSRDKVLFNYVSPFNEPQWDWSDHGQEGSPYLSQYTIASKAMACH